MSNSKLVTVNVPAYSGNYTKNRGLQWTDTGYASITMITIHHMAGVLTAAQCGTIFQTPGRCGSSHYGIGYDGSVGLYVNESDVAWTNSNWDSNCHAVTIEASNCSIGGSYPVNDVTYNKLIQLVADIAKRNNLGKLVAGKNLTWHSMYAATGCPGDYLHERVEDIAAKANNINYNKPVPTTNYYPIDGVNKPRYDDQLIIYTKGGTSTGTNDYGYEVIVNSSGIATIDPTFSGNHKVPEDGMVVSGHGVAGQWMKNKIKKGDSLVARNNYLYLNPKGFHKLTGINIKRYTDFLVLYKEPQTSTETNKWGAEIPCDKNNIMLSNPVQGVGNMEVPHKGSVLSAVNSSKTWMTNVAKSGMRYTLDAMNNVVIDQGQHRTVDGYNTARGTNQLVIYNKAGKSTGTNKWGAEVAIVNGVAVSDPVDHVGKMVVPEGGYVLSGHGDSEKWLLTNVHKGTKITNKGEYIRIGG